MPFDKDNGYLIAIKRGETGQIIKYVCDDKTALNPFFAYDVTIDITKARVFNLDEAYRMCLKWHAANSLQHLYYLTELTPKEQFMIRLGQVPNNINMHTIESTEHYMTSRDTDAV